MAEDLPTTLGSHCAYSSCNELDFLPISCPHCSLIFCRHHASTAAHACTQDPHNRIVSTPSRFEQKFNDLLPDPNRLVGERAAVEQERNDKTEAARKVLEKNFGREAVAKLGDGAGVKRASSSTDSAATRPSPKVVSPVIALMKLKQRAKPVDNKAKELAMDDRLYLTVELLEGEGQVKRGERELWISKVTESTFAGRVVR